MSLLTSKLSDENRKKAHELFGVPEQFDEVADLMVHEEEWQVILLMGKEPMTEKELRKLMEKNRLAASPYVLINRMYSRNVLNKVTDADEPTWKISDFYSRYSYYAQFEYYEFGCLPRELIEALYDWQTEIYQSIYLPQVKAKVAGEGVYVHNQTYLTLEEFDWWLYEGAPDYKIWNEDSIRSSTGITAASILCPATARARSISTTASSMCAST